MTHDQNFKNLFPDFPKEALLWLLPQVPKAWGPVKRVDFLRQEPKKWSLRHAHLERRWFQCFEIGKSQKDPKPADLFSTQRRRER